MSLRETQYIYSELGKSNSESKLKNSIKKGIWAYFILLVFEGALRKWIFPGLATPLLIIRDPIALWVIYKVWEFGVFPKASYVLTIVAIGFISIFTALFFGHGNLPVSLYGARILLIHFPFMYAMGKILDRDDVLEMGRALLYISIPMALLIGLQFYSPQSAWVNRGVGGDEAGAGFSGALGYFRPSGTFSFTNGNTHFFSLVSPFVIYFWLNSKLINRTILVCATMALIASIPLSISRSLFFSIIINLLFAMIGASANSKLVGRAIAAASLIAISIAILSQLSFFRTATEAFTTRFTVANEVEGGIEGVVGDRYFGGLLGALKTSTIQPFFGLGIGLGTNVGSKLTTGQTTFLISEGEWGRLIGEMGPILGLTVIFIRLAFTWQLCIASFHSMRNGKLLPWLLVSYGLLIIPQGQWAQPTSLGFSTLLGGLIIASMKNKREISDQTSYEAN